MDPARSPPRPLRHEVARHDAWDPTAPTYPEKLRSVRNPWDPAKPEAVNVVMPAKATVTDRRCSACDHRFRRWTRHAPMGTWVPHICRRCAEGAHVGKCEQVGLYIRSSWCLACTERSRNGRGIPSLQTSDWPAFAAARIIVRDLEAEKKTWGWEEEISKADRMTVEALMDTPPPSPDDGDDQASLPELEEKFWKIFSCGKDDDDEQTSDGVGWCGRMRERLMKRSDADLLKPLEVWDLRPDASDESFREAQAQRLEERFSQPDKTLTEKYKCWIRLACLEGMLKAREVDNRPAFSLTPPPLEERYNEPLELNVVLERQIERESLNKHLLDQLATITALSTLIEEADPFEPCEDEDSVPDVHTKEPCACPFAKARRGEDFADFLIRHRLFPEFGETSELLSTPDPLPHLRC